MHKSRQERRASSSLEAYVDVPLASRQMYSSSVAINGSANHVHQPLKRHHLRMRHAEVDVRAAAKMTDPDEGLGHFVGC
jgi:hypothetical protein